MSHFLGSYKGKTIFNFCYGFGASLAILGTMFKLLHLDGANIALAIGLGTEVFIFALSAFEPPFRNYRWEQVFPILKSHKEEDKPDFSSLGGTVNIVGTVTAQEKPTDVKAAASTVVVGKATAQAAQSAPPVVDATGKAESPSSTEGIVSTNPDTDQLADLGNITDVTERYMKQLSSMADNLNRFNDATNSLTTVSNILLESYQSITENSTSISENSRGYVEQMGYLNKNLYGLNTIYEIQLKSISSQIDTIDRINKGLVHVRDMYEGSMDGSERFRQETENMAENLAQLNRLYTRMLEAMTPGQGFPGFMGSKPTPPSGTETPSTEQAK